MILITGSSGQLAGQIAKGAKAAGLDVITASRAPDADRLLDFDKPETLDFSDVETLFLTSAGYAEDDVVMRRHGSVLTSARAHGVKRVIYTSLSKASDHLGFALAHRWTEREIKASGLDWIILRNGLYAELIGAVVAPQNGRITAPFGYGRISAVARDDLAQAAIAVLSNPEVHVRRSYELSGAASFTVAELAARISVSYEPVALEVERNRLASQPLMPFQAPMLMSIASAASAGFLETDETDLKKLVASPRDALEIACAVASSLG